MKVLLLGGQSPHHYDWVRELRDIFEEHELEVVLHDYAHWLKDEPNIDFEHELAAVAELAADIEDEYLIVAKSIGTVLAAVGNARGVLRPKGCLLLGFPLTSFEHNEDVAAALTQLPMTIFVQNEHDPLGSYDALRQYLAPHAPTATVTIPLPGDTHSYDDLQTIAQLAVKLQVSAS